MSAEENMINELVEGFKVGTRPSDQMRLGCNQVPDLARKIKNRFGSDAISKNMKEIAQNGRKKMVAEYFMTPKQIQRVKAQI